MEQISFRRNDVIFRQGDPADCMYAVRSGAVAVVLDCGGPDETKLTELRAGQYLGEMGLLDSAPRSATAVSLSDDTVLERIAESDFQAFFDENPELLLSMLQQMSSRLRRVTRDYAGACRPKRPGRISALRSATALPRHSPAMKALRPPMALTNERRGVHTVNNRTFSLGDIIFRQQDPSDLMYEICRGRVGIFLDYETENQKMIADLSDGQFFGEMGVIEGSPRSATAVSLADGTLLRPVTEDELPAFLRENPDRLLALMRQLSARTRERTLQYHEVCRALSAAVAAHKQGAEKDPALKQELEHISQAAEKPAKKKSYNPAVNTALFRYVLDDLEKTEGNRELVRVGFLERRRVRHLSPRELHVNPDDEFTDPNIGPSDRIISEYMDLIRNLQFQRADIFDEPVLVNKMKAGGYMISL